MLSSNTRAISIVSATALILGTCLPAGLAFATDPDPNDPSVEGQTGTGTTEMAVKIANAGVEYGGTDATGGYSNPDTDDPPDEIGNNLAFTVPSKINFVMRPNGTLVPPTSGSIYIDNESAYGIRVSSLDVDAKVGWNIVEDAAASNELNSVSGKIGPDGDQLDWFSYLDKKDVTLPAKWNLKADGASDGKDQLPISISEGRIAHANENLNDFTTFGYIRWYLRSGIYEAEPELPETDGTSLVGDNATLTKLSSIGKYLRSGKANDEYVARAEELVGKTIDVELKTESTPGVKDTMTVRLVDVDTNPNTGGLTFEEVDLLTRVNMNSTDTYADGWAGSDLRKSMNQESYVQKYHDTIITTGVYTTYFQGTDLDAEGIIHPRSNSSYNYVQVDGANVTLSTDKYWIECANNLFGPNWNYEGSDSSDRFTDGETEKQFDYYAKMTTNKPYYGNRRNPVLVKKYKGSTASSGWRLRSAMTIDNWRCLGISVDDGALAFGSAYSSSGGSAIAVCFTL